MMGVADHQGLAKRCAPGNARAPSGRREGGNYVSDAKASRRLRAALQADWMRYAIFTPLTGSSGSIRAYRM